MTILVCQLHVYKDYYDFNVYNYLHIYVIHIVQLFIFNHNSFHHFYYSYTYRKIYKMPNCSAFGCTNRFSDNPDLRFHRIPTEKKFWFT